MPEQMNRKDLLKEAPLAAMLRQARLFERAGFHMPGHAGGRAWPAEFREEGLLWDTTETSLTDNLLAPAEGGAVLAAEAEASRYWGSGGALFLAQGATQGLQAMLLYYVGKGGRLLVTGPAHKAVWQAAALLDIEIKVLPAAEADEAPEEDAGRPPMPPAASGERLRAFLDEDRAFGALLCTAPDYYGQIPDTEGLARAAEERGLAFLLDAAHGAHLKACGLSFPGAYTAAVMSTHKTLPALTGGAVVLTKEPGDVEGLRHAADIWGSSSPSLLIAASSDYARAYAEFEGGERFRILREAAETFGKALHPLYKLHFYQDPLRPVIDVSAVGPGTQIEKQLAARGIAVEMADLCRLVLIVPLAADPAWFGLLAEALNALAAEAAETPWREADRRLAFCYRRQRERTPVLPRRGAPEQTVLLTPAEASRAKAPLAEELVPYPPGVPLFLPGDVLEEADAALLETLSACGLTVNGLTGSKDRLLVRCRTN